MCTEKGQNMYKIIQGQNFPIRVYSNNSTLIMKDQLDILSFTNSPPDPQTGEIWINVLIDQDNFISAGLKQYQLFEGNVLKQSGTLEVVASLLVDSSQDMRGRYKVIVEAIQAQLAGVATKANRHIQVGDKTIEKYSASELLALLNYFQGKLAEEQSGTDINTKTDQMQIKYVWRVR